jgi:hypothetical protein
VALTSGGWAMVVEDGAAEAGTLRSHHRSCRGAASFNRAFSDPAAPQGPLPPGWRGAARTPTAVLPNVCITSSDFPNGLCWH